MGLSGCRIFGEFIDPNVQKPAEACDWYLSLPVTAEFCGSKTSEFFENGIEGGF